MLKTMICTGPSQHSETNFWCEGLSQLTRQPNQYTALVQLPTGVGLTLDIYNVATSSSYCLKVIMTTVFMATKRFHKVAPTKNY